MELARSTDDPGTAGTAEALLGEILIDAGQTPEAVQILQAAADAFPETGNPAVRAEILGNLSRALMRTSEPAKAIVAADLALDVAEHLGLERIVAETFNNKASSLLYLGRRREGAALMRAAIEVAHAGGFVAAEIRALSNSGSSNDDPRHARQAYRAAADLARRVGHRSLAQWAMVAALYQDYVLADDWDAAIATGEEFREDADSPLDEIRRITGVAIFRSARGMAIDATIARLEVLVTEVSDPYANCALHHLRSERAMMAGDYALACDELLLAADDDQLSWFYLALAMHSALWAGDSARARLVATRLDADVSSGAATAADRVAAHAGIAALEGRPDEAVAGYRDALARYRVIGTDLDIARIGLDFVTLIGPNHPATRDVVPEARAIFERVNARFYLDRLDEAVAKAAPGGRSAQVPSRAPVTEAKPA